MTGRGNLYILAFVLVVVTLGYGVVIPIIPFYMESLGAGGTELGLLVASYGIMRMIYAPVWGVVSDRIGRKPVMIIGIFGYGITMLLFGLATQLWMLFAARIVSGILSSATSPTTLAYVGDSTAEKDRSSGMGILGAAGGLGTIFGPGLGGLLGGQSYEVPFFIAAGMSFLAMLLVAAFLPETHVRQHTVEGSSGTRFQRINSQQITRACDKAACWLSRASFVSIQPILALLGMVFLASFALTAYFGIFGL